MLQTAVHRDVTTPGTGIPTVPKGQHAMDTVSTVSRSTSAKGTEMLTTALMLDTVTYVGVAHLGDTTLMLRELDDFARPNDAGTLMVTVPDVIINGSRSAAIQVDPTTVNCNLDETLLSR